MQRDVRRNGKLHLPLTNTRREPTDHIRLSATQIESTQDDPRTFHNGGDFDDFPGKYSFNPPARFWLIDQDYSHLK